MDSQDLESRFRCHPPVTDARREAHENVRYRCYSLAKVLNDVLPEGREKSLAITNIEQVMFWANASIARQPQEGQ
jgi:hypothetical protein